MSKIRKYLIYWSLCNSPLAMIVMYGFSREDGLTIFDFECFAYVIGTGLITLIPVYAFTYGSDERAYGEIKYEEFLVLRGFLYMVSVLINVLYTYLIIRSRLEAFGWH